MCLFYTNHTPTPKLPARVFPAVVCKGKRVPEAHHGAAQGERLRLRHLQPTLCAESHVQRSPGHPPRAAARPCSAEVRPREAEPKHVFGAAHVFV